MFKKLAIINCLSVEGPYYLNRFKGNESACALSLKVIVILKLPIGPTLAIPVLF